MIANWLVTECGARVHGVDGQAEFLSFAVPHDAMTVEQADLRDYQPQGIFDGVLIFGVINHLPDETVRDDLYRRIVASLSPGGFILIKCQFGVDGPVEVNTYSEALGGPYYSVYPWLAAEADLLSRRLDTQILDLYPPELSPHSNTRFLHLLGTKRD